MGELLYICRDIWFNGGERRREAEERNIISQREMELIYIFQTVFLLLKLMCRSTIAERQREKEKHGK